MVPCIFQCYHNNIINAFINFLVFLSCKIIKAKNVDNHDKKNIKALRYINTRFLIAPEIAVVQLKKEIINMAKLSKINL